MSTTPPPRRSALQILDLVAGIALTAIGALIGIIMLAYVTQLGQVAAVCEGVAEDGTRCSAAFLAAMGVVGTAVVVFAWFLGAGFLIVRAIRRRVVFWLPIAAVVVMIAGFYLVTALVSGAYLPAAG